jgi:maleate isomerase
MYGWRKRIGLVLPSSNTTMEPELYRMLPEGISLHTARALQVIETEEELVRMGDYAKRASEEVATAAVDVIIYGCTSGSFVKGEEYNRNFSKELTEHAGIEVITTSTALRLALEALGARKICLVTPYPKETNERGRRWLVSLGFSVVKTVELIESTYAEPIENLEIGRLSPQLVYANIRPHFPMKIDTLLISCTNLRTIEIIDILETDLGIPVVTSNQASLWAAIRRSGIKTPIAGFGQLMLK